MPHPRNRKSVVVRIAARAAVAAGACLPLLPATACGQLGLLSQAIRALRPDPEPAYLVEADRKVAPPPQALIENAAPNPAATRVNYEYGSNNPHPESLWNEQVAPQTYVAKSADPMATVTTATVNARRTAPQHAPTTSAASAAANKPVVAFPGIAKARQQLSYAEDLAKRGAVHSAEKEYTEALWTVAHALDARDRSTTHTAALQVALLTMDEAEMFAPTIRAPSGSDDVKRLAASHRNPAAKLVAETGASPLQALQVYYEFARKKLTDAVGELPTGAESLYGLARVQLAHSKAKTSTSQLAQAKAMSLLLAATEVDPQNYRATNELGVLYAQFGQLAHAETMLKRSAESLQRAETWQNLAKVYEMAGREDWARQAIARSQSLPTERDIAMSSTIKWVPVKQFAETPTAEIDKVQQASVTDEVNETAPKKANWLSKIFGGDN